MRYRRCCIAALAALFVVAACDDPTPVSPDVPTLDASLGSSPTIEQHEDVAPLHGITDADVDGEAWLTRTADGLSVKVEASGDDIEAMDAFTFWAVAFNNPEACESDPCALSDLFITATGGTVLNFGGGYDMDGDATLAMNEGGGELARVSTEGAQVLIPGPDAPPGLNSGIKNPYRVEVHVILRNHGMKESDAADRAEQTSMVGAFCNLLDEGRDDTDDIPNDGCADQGVAIFLPPGAPGGS